jgi:hypothetical protein
MHGQEQCALFKSRDVMADSVVERQQITRSKIERTLKGSHLDVTGQNLY